MPGQTAAAHGACRSGGVFPQYSSLWSGVLPRVSENPDGAATRKYFPASRFRRSVTQWGSLNRRMNRFFGATGLFPYVGGARQAPRCHDRPRTHLLVLFLITAAYFCAAGCVRALFCAWAWRFFIFPSRLASQERHVSAAGFPAFLGGGSLASGQAVDDGRGAFPVLDFHSGCRAVASCGGHFMAEARRKEFARPGAGPQPRIFRFRIASVFAGCAGSFPFADGGAHLAVAVGIPLLCPCGAFRWGMPWRRRSP